MACAEELRFGEEIISTNAKKCKRKWHAVAEGRSAGSVERKAKRVKLPSPLVWVEKQIDERVF